MYFIHLSVEKPAYMFNVFNYYFPYTIQKCDHLDLSYKVWINVVSKYLFKFFCVYNILADCIFKTR